MGKVVSILVASFVWLSVGGGVALADGMLLPLPEALSPDYLAVRYHHVSVQIEDNHVVTRVEQEFYNPHDAAVQGRYLFPLPPEAILSRFEATVDGQLQEVTRQDREATNDALYAVVVQQRDPTLLQYADWESLAFDLHLLPGASREVVLEYEEVLAPTGGLYRYRYVLSTERYSSRPVEKVSVTVDLRSSSGLSSLYSSSHAVQTERLGPGRARVRWEGENTNPDKDFELYFAPAEEGFGGGLLTGRRGDQDHFLFLFSPQAELGQGGALPKDMVFVMDRSGSMGGEKLEQARNALHFILGQLGKDDRFSIVSFNEQLSTLAETLQPVEGGALQDARRFVDGLTADGSTDLEGALQAGLEILDSSTLRGATRMVVFMTDGLPTAGITDETLIARLVTQTNARLEARLHVFGVGYDVNTHLLDQLSADNGGTVTYVQPGENLEAALTEFFGRIAQPLLTDIEIDFEGLEASALYPQVLPDLFQGSSLLLAGRYQATTADGSVAVRVRGRAGDERREFVYHWNLGESGDHDFVARLWATRRVGALLDRVRVEGESQALAEEIRDLGLRYGLVTPYTTFVIEGQAEGAASAANMALYDSAEVNQASGQITIQARVQNQAYQQAAQASLAMGANVSHAGQHSLAQVGTQQVDLALLQGYAERTQDGPISDEWLERNVQVDRTLEFGSEEYLKLAADPEARPFLQSGRNVVFAYRGQVLAVQDAGDQGPGSGGSKAPVNAQATAPDSGQRGPRTRSLALHAVAELVRVLAPWAPRVAVAVLFGLLVVAAIAG
jgi:Ca-activated chloride channel family protein